MPTKLEAKTDWMIRKDIPSDGGEWARMREALWPGSLEEHLDEVNRYFSNNRQGLVEAFVLERDAGGLGGFIELNLRNWAEGSLADQVPYIEGWHAPRGFSWRLFSQGR